MRLTSGRSRRRRGSPPAGLGWRRSVLSVAAGRGGLPNVSVVSGTGDSSPWVPGCGFVRRVYRSMSGAPFGRRGAVKAAGEAPAGPETGWCAQQGRSGRSMLRCGPSLLRGGGGSVVDSSRRIARFSVPRRQGSEGQEGERTWAVRRASGAKSAGGRSRAGVAPGAEDLGGPRGVDRWERASCASQQTGIGRVARRGPVGGAERERSGS